MFSPFRLLPREKRPLVSSDRRDNRADHNCRAGIPVHQKDHDKK
jgi:hypothetical protein